MKFGGKEGVNSEDMNLAWLHRALHDVVQSKSSLSTRPRKRFLHRSNGHTPLSFLFSPSNRRRSLTNASSNREMNFLLLRNRSSPASVSSFSSSSSSSASASSNHSLPANTSFMRRGHVLGDLIRHSTKVYSLTTVAIIAGIFVMVTVATAAIVALFWCKRNAVFAFKGSESEEVDECEMDEFDTDYDDGEEPLCRTSGTEDCDEEEEDGEEEDGEEEEDGGEEEEEEEDEDEDEERRDEDGGGAGGGFSRLSILARTESASQTGSNCFPRAARTKTASTKTQRKSIFRGLKSFRFRSIDLVASSSATVDRVLHPGSLVSLLDHRHRGQLDHGRTDRPQRTSGEAVVYSTAEEMTSRLVQNGDVSSDDDEKTRDDARTMQSSPPPRRARFSGYRRLVVMATVEDETTSAAATGTISHPLVAAVPLPNSSYYPQS